MSKDTIQAIAFDFGNTLCPWDEEQYLQITRSTLSGICAHAPGHDFNSAYRVFSRILDRESARNLPRLLENDLVGVISDTAAALCGRPLSPSSLESLVDAHVAAFVEVCRTPDGVHAMLDRLSDKFKLAVVSNYPLSQCIRVSLATLGLDKYLDATIVSGDLGVIKPSRRLFDEACSALDLTPETILFVGDDWIADIVGAWASGMPCVQIVDSHGDSKPRSLEGVFGVYLRQALESPELRPWQEARPLAVLNSVLELEAWLEAIQA